MNSSQLFMQLSSRRKNLLGYHEAEVTPLMKSTLNNSLYGLNQRAIHSNTSITLIDLNESRFNFYKSVHKQHLAYPGIKTNERDNWNQLHPLIHPDDRQFCYESDIMGYKYLMSVAPEKRKLFQMTYMARLKHKDGSYGVYLHRIYPWLSDERDVPWVMIVETQQMPMCKAIQFQPYRTFCLISDESQEVFNRFEANNPNELTEKQLELLHLRCKKEKVRDVADKLYKNDQTLRNYCLNIYKRLSVTTREDAKQVATLLRIL
jgi:Response regulator containing a CheY-like receiver domain and an HTH DNA-binding domain